jgi:adenylylsulfate kinase
LPASIIIYNEKGEPRSQEGTVLWLTGLPCSGKTTLSTELQSRLSRNNTLVSTLDGDQVRRRLNSDLKFSREDRQENIRRIGEVAKLFADTGFIIIVAVIAPFQKDRQQLRDIFPLGQFIETYLECPIEECERRDVKGLYKQARNGKIPDFTGVSSPYEPPMKPDIHLKTHIQSQEECINDMLDYLILRNRISTTT